MKVIEGDITRITAGVILHQVNCLGKTGGLAWALRSIFPTQFRVYDEACAENVLHIEKLLGRARCGYANGVAVVHCFGQLRYGRSAQQTDLAAVDKALAEAKAGIAASLKLRDLPIYAPYNMGCGRGGANWTEYSPLLEKHFSGLTIVRHPRFAEGIGAPAVLTA